jgi:hypothetical protein
MPDWLGYVRPFHDRPDIRWPVLWSEALPDARPLPFPTVFTDRFWELREHFLPDNVGTDPEDMRVWKGAVPAAHTGLPIGTPAEFVQGLSYESWLAGAYASRVMDPCALHVTLHDSVRGAGRVEDTESVHVTLHDSVRGAGLVDQLLPSADRLTDTVRGAGRIESTETAAHSFGGCSSVGFTLYCHITAAGPCSALNGVVVTMAWDSANSWYAGSASYSGGTINARATASGGLTSLLLGCNTAPAAAGSAIATCGPYSASFGALLVMSCCAGGFSAVLNETP